MSNYFFIIFGDIFMLRMHVAGDIFIFFNNTEGGGLSAGAKFVWTSVLDELIFYLWRADYNLLKSRSPATLFPFLWVPITLVQIYIYSLVRS